MAEGANAEDALSGRPPATAHADLEAKADEGRPAEAVSDEKEKRRKKKKQTNGGVFESNPEPSRADVCHTDSSRNRAAEAQALIYAALEQADAPEHVFESQPQRSTAAVVAGARPVAADAHFYSQECCATVFESQPRMTAADAASGACTSHAEAARVLIQAAAEEGEEEGRSIFESVPKQVTADTGHSLGAVVALERLEGTSVFESAPVPSRADVMHCVASRHAESAEALILSAAERDEADSGAIFESQPQQSVAAVTHADKVLNIDAGVFESEPLPSIADVLHGRAAHKAVDKLGNLDNGNFPIAGVFESQPRKSTANVRYGEAVASESEYETDEEDTPKMLLGVRGS